MQSYAKRLHNHYAKLCKGMQSYAKLCKVMQSYAKQKYAKYKKTEDRITCLTLDGGPR